MRPLALAALVVWGSLAGCLADKETEGPRLAQPTTVPITIPPRPTSASPTVFVNLSDPGYVVATTWHVGDGWDYESNTSKVVRQRVIDERIVSNVHFFLLEERRGDADDEDLAVTQSWVEGRTWLRLNRTDESGVKDRYQPGAPLRYYRNGTATFALTRTDAAGGTLFEQNVSVYSRLFPVHETLLFPWGFVEAKKVEQITVTRDAAGNRAQSTTTSWVHRDYGNALWFEPQGGELYKLTAAKVGDFRRGTLAS